jgi:FkbM family methyltransferase
MKLARICEHTFIVDALSAHSVVIDGGSNLGVFARQIAALRNVRIFGFEPNPELYRKLVNSTSATFHESALGSQAGMAEILIGDPLFSSLCLKPPTVYGKRMVPVVELEGFCNVHGIDRIGLLKLDIEGSEIAVLSCLSGSFLSDRVEQVTVEFHDHLDATMKPDILKVCNRLDSLGFTRLKFSHFTFGDVLFVNRKWILVRLRERVRIQLAKSLNGLFRYLSWHVLRK